MLYKLAVVGSREYKDYESFEKLLDSLPKPESIVTGDAESGVEVFVARYATEKDIPFKVLSGESGKNTRFKLNCEIVTQTDALLAFWDCMSKGTLQAISFGITKQRHIKIIYTGVPSKDICLKGDVGFQGNRRWLSNMWPCEMKLGKYKFQSSEAAYQATKFASRPEIVHKFEGVSGRRVKKMVRELTQKGVEIDDGFHDRKLRWMHSIVYSKFKNNKYLREKLVLTKDKHLEGTNSRHDRFWGVCSGEGKNHLGKILMEIRPILIRARNKDEAEKKRILEETPLGT